MVRWCPAGRENRKAELVAGHFRSVWFARCWGPCHCYLSCNYRHSVFLYPVEGHSVCLPTGFCCSHSIRFPEYRLLSIDRVLSGRVSGSMPPHRNWFFLSRPLLTDSSPWFPHSLRLWRSDCCWFGYNVRLSRPFLPQSSGRWLSLYT